MKKIPLYNLKAEKIGDTVLPSEVFSIIPNDTVVARSIRVYLNNQRSANATTKHRGDVAGTTKKMWARKGTGRARHGSAKAPIFVGGGSAHGPRGERNFKLTLSPQQTRIATRSILSTFAANKAIIAIDKLSQLEPKTKTAWNLIDLLEKDIALLSKSKKIAIITNKHHRNLKRAFGNIPGITLISLQSLHPYYIANQNFLIFSPKAIASLK